MIIQHHGRWNVYKMKQHLVVFTQSATQLSYILYCAPISCSDFRFIPHLDELLSVLYVRAFLPLPPLSPSLFLSPHVKCSQVFNLHACRLILSPVMRIKWNNFFSLLLASKLNVRMIWLMHSRTLIHLLSSPAWRATTISHDFQMCWKKQFRPI